MAGDVEAVKAASRHLRGDIADDLARPDEPFEASSTVLLKFHGIYQQDDRDVRRERAAKRLPLDYSCMVRAAVPGGRLTPRQWLALDNVAALANDSLRLTTRQGVQFHATVKANLKPLISALNAELVTTLAACGDVVRNTMACPIDHDDGRQEVLGPAVAALVARFRPRTRAYWELWVDGERAASAEAPVTSDAGAEEEPIYGDTYLPRKFKIGLAWPGDNCVDVHSHDVGIVPTLSDGYTGTLTGWTVLIGGGLGMSHAREHDTYPRLATPVAWVTPDRLVDVVEAVITLQRDHGRRDDRSQARLKYLVDARGIDWARAEIERRIGAVDDPPPLLEWVDNDEHHGWSAVDGVFSVGIPVPSGRLRDSETWRPRAALRELIAAGLIGEVRVTPRQDLLLVGITDRAAVGEVLARHGVRQADEQSQLQRLSIACPALPTCGQALGEAERALPGVVDDLAVAFADAGVDDPRLRLNMSGCPNGCSRPYNSEIGIVGRTKKNYDVYVGGSPHGDRLGFRLRADVPLGEVAATLAPVIERYARRPSADESFGDFCAREGGAALEVLLPPPQARRRGAVAS